MKQPNKPQTQQKSMSHYHCKYTSCSNGQATNEKNTTATRHDKKKMDKMKDQAVHILCIYLVDYCPLDICTR